MIWIKLRNKHAKLLQILLLSGVLLLVGCQAHDGQSPRPDPLVDAVAPVAVSVFVPEPWRSLVLLLMGGGLGGVVGRKTGNKE